MESFCQEQCLKRAVLGIPPRFLTNSNVGGVEKLCCSLPISGMMGTRPGISASEVSASPNALKLVAPLGLLFVKGWTRSLAAHCVMYHAFENRQFLEAGSGDLRCVSRCACLQFAHTQSDLMFFAGGTSRGCEDVACLLPFGVNLISLAMM